MKTNFIKAVEIMKNGNPLFLNNNNYSLILFWQLTEKNEFIGSIIKTNKNNQRKKTQSLYDNVLFFNKVKTILKNKNIIFLNPQ